MKEIWKPIPGWSGYEVSDRGQVRSSKSGVARLKSQSLDGPGYLKVALYNGSKNSRKTVRVANLVLLAFQGEKPRNFDTCHINGDRLDNRLENLKYASRSENIKDKVLHGTHNWLSANRGTACCERCGREMDRYAVVTHQNRCGTT